MSKKNMSISAQIESLEEELSRLRSLENMSLKMLDQLLKSNYGLGNNELKNMLEFGTKNDVFEGKISKYFNLKNATEKDTFISIMCNEASRKYYKEMLQKIPKNTHNVDQ
ncbi:hypothetical protein [Butyrivibrio sp. WCD3002]|uniref:hypothetical protein n=1 Tax=Butyrivibrio sp. WCD3002 TaxID=1280676 RepID=UPI0004024E83|nr:hypothetical protein [Butyrivibrio sp. WCD3002]